MEYLIGWSPRSWDGIILFFNERGLKLKLRGNTVRLSNKTVSSKRSGFEMNYTKYPQVVELMWNIIRAIVMFALDIDTAEEVDFYLMKFHDELKCEEEGEAAA